MAATSSTCENRFCGGALGAESAVRTENDLVYHQSCVCENCGESIEDEYVTANKRNWHVDCVCGSCDKPFMGNEAVSSFDLEYHPQCYKCQKCGLGLLKAFRNAVGVAGKPYCEECVNNHQDLYSQWKKGGKVKGRRKGIKHPKTHPLHATAKPGAASASAAAPRTTKANVKSKRKQKARSPQAMGDEHSEEAIEAEAMAAFQKKKEEAQKQSQQATNQKKKEQQDTITKTKVIVCCTVM